MITTKNEETSVIFAQPGKAPTLALSVEDYNLVIRQTAFPTKIGEKITLDKVQELPNVKLKFSNIESIDVLIELLNRVKQNLQQPPSPNFNMAC